MVKTSEGVRRLSLFVGGGAATVWFFVVLLNSLRWGWEQEYAWAFFMVGVGLWFAGIILVRGTVRIGAWLTDGFKK